jgi:transcriptional regulator with XRE-family HTH domain
MAFEGKGLRHWRIDKDLTLAHASAMFGITPQHLSCIERGKRKPSNGLLDVILTATGLKYEAL